MFDIDELRSNFDTLTGAGENWLSIYTRMYLNNALIQLPNNARVVEVGSWLGRSACYMIERRPDIDLYCIDTWEGSEEHEESQVKDLYNRFISNMKSLNYLDRIKIIRDHSHNISSHFKENSIDMIFLDGSHEEDDVHQDIHNSYRLLKIMGKLVGDDWNFNSVSKGLMKAYWEINIDKEKLWPLTTLVTAYSTFKKE